MWVMTGLDKALIWSALQWHAVEYICENLFFEIGRYYGKVFSPAAFCLF